MNKHTMNEDLEKAWTFINKEFPFENYIPSARKSSYFEMPNSVSQYQKKGAKILDFGAGSCDKTAMLSLSGFDVVAFDDFGDDWYNFKGNTKKILDFAKKAGINYIHPDEDGNINFPENHYDAIILNNVVEHFHDSPHGLLSTLIKSLKIGGNIFIAVPNAVNLRKRIDVVRGKTNYSPFAYYYWANPWRGHIREYVKDDLEKMGQFLELNTQEISTHHYHLDVISPFKRIVFKAICRIFPSFRESWLYVGQKTESWKERLKPNKEEFKMAFDKQYFDYKEEMFDE